MFVASSCEPLPSCSNYASGSQKKAPPGMSHVLLVKVLHSVNFVNINNVKS